MAIALSITCAEEPRNLTLLEAHETALRNHPRITVADLKALAAKQITREARSAFFPNIYGSVVAVGTAEDNTRLAAIGGLNNPSIFNRNAEGLNVSQLITDFGRTANLTGSAKERALAEENTAQAAREQILLEVDNAFYSGLEAQAVARVAEKTVAARKSFLDQVAAMATNKLRSDLDVSFARVSLEEADLLLSKSRSDLEAADAQIANLLGERQPQTFHLVEGPLPANLSTNTAALVEQALQSRPDLLALRHSQEATHRFTKAERAARYPTIAALGSAGVVPIHDLQLPDHYAAAGVTLNLPLFSGGLYAARAKEAELRARAADAQLLDAENAVVRDIRIAWLNTQNAFERMGMTAHLVENATRSYDLAQARYKNGVSSIVELNQAQLNEVSAEIEYENTKYEYLLRLSALHFQTGSLQ
jgi:outer membrane protein